MPRTQRWEDADTIAARVYDYSMWWNLIYGLTAILVFWFMATTILYDKR